MSKKAFKSQASSSRAVSGALGVFADGTPFSGLGGVTSSPLSYIYEPPDLSGLSDPHVVVAFKNLQKKDSITKSKALEDLQSYLRLLEQNTGEDALLEAWVKVYPRTSIDSSRRVRQLAHTIQGQIAAFYGKRTARCMPQLIGAWLAGLYDNDKSVIRAAQESFKLVFPTDEKYGNVWRVYQSDIVHFCETVVEKENISTLSDERSTSPDDAMSKYTRTLGAVIIMSAKLIEVVPRLYLAKSQSELDNLFKSARLWEFSSYPDAFVRRSVYKLLISLLSKRKDALDPRVVSSCILTSGLHTNQTGSSYDFAKAMMALSVEIPSVWTDDYQGTGKKSARTRLCYFLRKGSCGGPADFWNLIGNLVKSLPVSIVIDALGIPASDSSDNRATSSIQLLDALHQGVIDKDEPRTNSGAAWRAYLTIFAHIYEAWEEGQRTGLLETYILPLVAQNIKPSLENNEWSIVGSDSLDICLRACLYTLSRDGDLFLDRWRGLSLQVIEDLKTSLPEQSKDYNRSQDSLTTETARWYTLHSMLIKEDQTASVRGTLSETLHAELDAAITTLCNRNGKPYGVAASLDKAIQLFPDVILASDVIKSQLCEFANEKLPQLILSPSTRYLIHSLDLLQRTCDVRHGLTSSTNILTVAPISPQRSTALRALLSSSAIASNGSLASVASKTLDKALAEDNIDDWKLVNAALGNSEAPKALTDDLLTTMTANLSLETRPESSLHGLELCYADSMQVVREYSASAAGSTLIAKLLFLADGPDVPSTHRARALSYALQDKPVADGAKTPAFNPSISIIKQSFEAVDQESLSVATLCAQAKKTWEQTPTEEKPAMLDKILPDHRQWAEALAPFLTRPPNLSLAITTSLGGSVQLVTDTEPTATEVLYDGFGQSLAVRLVAYVIHLVSDINVFSLISDSQQMALIMNLAIFLELSGDNLSVQGSMPLWVSSVPDFDIFIVDITTKVQGLLSQWFYDVPESQSSTTLRTSLLQNCLGMTSTSYYHGRAFSSISAELNERHGALQDDSKYQLSAVSKAENFFLSIAVLSCAQESREIVRLCNELIANLTVHDFEKEETKGLRLLILLNSTLPSVEEHVSDAPQQRLVFFVKHLVSQIQKTSKGCQTEILTVWKSALPLIKDIYGTFWDDVFMFLRDVSRSAVADEVLPLVAASLRLLSRLRKEDMLDGNDDILDSWKEHKPTIAKGLLTLASNMKDFPDTSHQPRRIINGILRRLLIGLTAQLADAENDLYPILAAEAEDLQIAGLEILRDVIPLKQEQLSLDKALERSFEAKLPEELLSLILASPQMEELAEISLDRSLLPSLRSYLFSWKLIADHWTRASIALQADYSKSLQEGTYLPDLLNLAFRLLITSRHKPIDASRFIIRSYEPGHEPPEKDIHWLLIHLYWMILVHIPTPAKAWWRDTTSRQTGIAVQAWTEKYISPSVIATELNIIRDWAPSQQRDAEFPLTVRISQTTHEITAFIPVDEQTTSISIRLPPSYPLTRAEVTGVHRVGVAENKWLSWIRNAQGQLTISEGGSNALIDCLLAWRRNVTASMKGQTECAICYSVVAIDKSLPKKECPTCKNRFHAGCLFKWFKSSNSSSCPLCRNTFAYS